MPSKQCIFVSPHVKFNDTIMMGGHFQAEGEDQFLYSSLKLTFNKPTPAPTIEIEHIKTKLIVAPSNSYIILDQP